MHLNNYFPFLLNSNVKNVYNILIRRFVGQNHDLMLYINYYFTVNFFFF